MYTLITGASSGIGEEFARQYASKGRNLLLTARSKEKLEHLAQDLSKAHNITVHVIEQDLAKLEGAEELYKKYQTFGIEIDLLINNAGVGLIGKFDSHPLPKIEEMVVLNIISLTKLCHLFLPEIKKSRGAILNVASQAAFEPTPYMSSYAATKSYVLSFSEALRVELEEASVKVMALCPGPTYTQFFERHNYSTDDINFKFRTPDEVVKAAIEGLERGEDIMIPGWENRIWTFVTHLLPKSVLAKLSHQIIDGRHK